MRRLVIVVAIALALGGALWSGSDKPGADHAAQSAHNQTSDSLQARRAAARGSLKVQNQDAADTASSTTRAPRGPRYARNPRAPRTSATIARADLKQSPPDPTDSTYEEYMRQRQATINDQTDAAAATDSNIEEPSIIEAATSPFSFQLSVDLTNAYFFRGIIQQDDDLIVQPAAQMNIRLHERNDFRVDATLGVWNSFGKNSGDNDRSALKHWYEADLYAGFIVTKDKLSLTTTYTWYTSPSDAFRTVEELTFTLAFNDRDYLGKFSLQPYATLGIETGTNFADGADSDRGTYLELGIAPGFGFDLARTPITITFPISVGLSLNDYYQDAAGEDDTFGFLQAGVNASFPLPIDKSAGAWTLNAGASILYLGDHTADYNGGDDTEFIGTIGIQWSF